MSTATQPSVSLHAGNVLAVGAESLTAAMAAAEFADSPMAPAMQGQLGVAAVLPRVMQAQAVTTGSASGDQAVTRDCVNGGTMSLSTRASDHTTTTIYEHCDDGDIIDGRSVSEVLAGPYDADTGRASFVATTTFTGYSVTDRESGQSMSLAGTVTVDFEGDILGVNRSVVSSDGLEIVEDDGGGTPMRRVLSDMQVTIAFDAEGRQSVSGHSVIDSDVIGGRVRHEIIAPFVTALAGEAPEAGSARITGANGSELRLTVGAGGALRLDLDSNGDGRIDLSRDVSWSALVQP